LHYSIEVRLIIRHSALKHGLAEASIAHAVTYPLLVDDQFEEDTPKVLVLGPDRAGNVLEVIGLFDNADDFVVFHAMPARTGYLRMLERNENQ
jgi:hypothetical protein